MAADYTAYKPTAGDTQYATKINDFLDAVATDMNTKLDSSAVVNKSVVTKTSAYTTTAADYTVRIDATVADVTITLHSASANTGQILVFVRIDTAGYLGIIGTVYTLYCKHETVTIQSNGTAWEVIG